MSTSNKNRTTITAYNLFVRTCREELRRKYPQLNVEYTIIAKKCSERWKGMNEKEKKRFNETADFNRKRQQKDKKVKDPHAPKKPLSAYFLFCADERPKLLNNQTGMSVSEAARELGARWKTVPAEIKSKYEQMALEQKDLYRNEMANYKNQTLIPTDDFSTHLPSFLIESDPNFHSSFDLSETPNEFELIHSEHQM